MRGDFIKFGKKVLALVSLVAIFYSPVLYFNVVTDPYGIFRKDFTGQRIEPNGHFIKMRHLLDNPEAYDSFIFGNSRANNIDNTRLPDGRWYNLYYSLGFPKEHLKDLEILTGNSVRVKNILLCLDMSAYLVTYGNRSADMLRKPYPESNWAVFKSYIEYAFQVPDMKFWQDVYRVAPDSTYRAILVSGRATNEEKEKYIQEHTAEFDKSDIFSVPLIMGYEDHTEEALQDINRFLEFCRAHGIRCKVLVNPIHVSAFLSNNPQQYFRFLEGLAKITDYYDFTGINKITSTNHLFYEPAHYRPIVGNAMIDFIYRGIKIDSVPDFGYHVNAENILPHIDQLKSQVANRQ